MKKTKLPIGMLILILFFSTVVNAGEQTNIRISIQQKALNIPSEYGYPFLDNQSRTMIPLRIVSESLGHKVEWNQVEEKASIDGSVHITIGEKFVETGSGNIEMDTWAILKGGRTYVPLRFVVEALGYEVTYDGPKASNGHHHMVDIFKEGLDIGPIEQDDGSILSPTKDFTKDSALNDFFANQPKENVVIAPKGVQFDSTGGVKSALTAICLINEMEGRGYYSLTIKHYNEEEQKALEYLLKNVAGQEAGQKMKEWIEEGREKGHPMSQVNSWVEMTNGVEIYKDKENSPTIGVLYYLRPIK